MSARRRGAAAPAGRRALCLVVLDGWGLAEPGPGNAVSLARTPVFDELWRDLPAHDADAPCGRAVGLPEGQMGNSRGRPPQPRRRRGRAPGPRAHRRRDRRRRAGEPTRCCARRFAGAERVHLLGLVSDGGVHSSLEHLRALIALARRARRREVGRARVHRRARHAAARRAPATWPSSTRTPGARVGSVIGRYWAMDRDRRWERTQRAYDLLVHGRAPYSAPRAASRPCATPTSAARPTSSSSPRSSASEARSRAGDSVLGFNFRPDRMRQLDARAGRAGLRRGAGEAAPRLARARRRARRSRATRRSPIRGGLALPGRVRPRAPATTLARGARARRAAQLHVAETEKYPHVTYFFNGGEEAAAARASGASSCPRRATCRPTTTSRR